MPCRVIEEESGTATRYRCKHDGYWSGDFSQVPFRSPLGQGGLWGPQRQPRRTAADDNTSTRVFDGG